MLAYWRNGHLQSRIESWAAAAIPKRLEYSYPLLDRRILEFMVGVPAEYLVHKGGGRYLFRSAAEKLLPDSILWTDAKEEKSRVKRLVALVLSAGKMLLAADKERGGKQSDYIDIKKLRNVLGKLEITSMSREELLLIQGIEVSLTVICSVELNK